jgi:hypothetical protein
VKQSKTVWWVRGVEAGKRGGPWGREEQLTAKAWDGAHASEICWRPSTRHEGRERERRVAVVRDSAAVDRCTVSSLTESTCQCTCSYCGGAFF